MEEEECDASPVKKEKIDGKHPRPPGAPRKGKCKSVDAEDDSSSPLTKKND